MNPAQHISQAVKFQKRVWLEGTADDVYPAGFGVCYNRDYGTAADNQGRRDKYVEKPSQTNHKWFAGVLDAKVTIPSTGGISVLINEPGSTCLIAIGGQSAAVSATRFGLSCGGADAGRFTLSGLEGRGGALALQTSTVKSEFMDGTAAYTHSDKTLTDSGEFTGVVAGDRCVIVGFDGGTVGIYTVASRTDDTLVFATDIGGAADRALVAGYVIGAGETTILAKLLDGPMSGVQEVVQLVDNVAFVLMVGGYSYLAPGTLTTGDAVETIDDGTFEGDRKVIHCLGANATNDADVTITHHDTSDPEHLFFKAAKDFTVLDWFVDGWHAIASNAPTTT